MPWVSCSVFHASVAALIRCCCCDSKIAIFSRSDCLPASSAAISFRTFTLVRSSPVSPSVLSRTPPPDDALDSSSGLTEMSAPAAYGSDMHTTAVGSSNTSWKLSSRTPPDELLCPELLGELDELLAFRAFSLPRHRFCLSAKSESGDGIRSNVPWEWTLKLSLVVSDQLAESSDS